MKIPESLKKYLLMKFSFPYYSDYSEKHTPQIIDFEMAVKNRGAIEFNGILVDREYQIVLPMIPFPSTHESVALLLGKTHCEGTPHNENQWYSFEFDVYDYINGRRSDRRNNDYSRSFFRNGYYITRNQYALLREECAPCMCSWSYRFDMSDQLLLKAIGCDRFFYAD